MIIDCDGCGVRGDACGECVIGVLLGSPAGCGAGPDAGEDTPEGLPPGASIVQFDAPERRALDVLADQGLIPRLRLVAAPSRRASPDAEDAGTVRDVG